MHKEGDRMRIRARTISRGRAEGVAVVSEKPVSFLGDVDPETGDIVDRNSDVFGENISGKIFIFPESRGSTVGTYVLLQMRKKGTAPAGIVMLESEAIVAVGAIISEIPLVDRPEINVLDMVKNGDRVRITAGREGLIEIDR